MKTRGQFFCSPKETTAEKESYTIALMNPQAKKTIPITHKKTKSLQGKKGKGCGLQSPLSITLSIRNKKKRKREQ